MWNLLPGAGGGGGEWVLKKAFYAGAPPRGPAPPFHTSVFDRKGSPLYTFN